MTENFNLFFSSVELWSGVFDGLEFATVERLLALGAGDAVASTAVWPTVVVERAVGVDVTVVRVGLRDDEVVGTARTFRDVRHTSRMRLANNLCTKQSRWRVGRAMRPHTRHGMRGERRRRSGTR